MILPCYHGYLYLNKQIHEAKSLKIKNNLDIYKIQFCKLKVLSVKSALLLYYKMNLDDNQYSICISLPNTFSGY